MVEQLTRFKNWLIKHDFDFILDPFYWFWVFIGWLIGSALAHVFLIPWMQ